MIVVSDSSPLISLAILNKLAILDQLFDEIYIPRAVYEEITQQNRPYSQELKNFATNRVQQVQNQLAVQLLQKELDIGESEAIVLAIEIGKIQIILESV